MHADSNTAPQYITLTEIANITPGRPSANCVWRWCRRGVKSRTGERIHLQHVRMGGTIFSTREWVDEFGRRLAEADAKYFDQVNDRGHEHRAPRISRGGRSRCDEARRKAIEDADRELTAAGI